MTRQKIFDSGGRMNPAAVWPAISHAIAQMMSDAMKGMRIAADRHGRP